MVGWPVPEYQFNVRESILSSLGMPNLVANGNGTFTYTYISTDIPTNTGDTFAVGMEGRRDFEFRGNTERQGIEDNGLVYFTTDGSEPVMRREIIADEKCNTCHKQLHLHGANRTGVDYCVICHNPNLTDVSRRPAEEMPPESVHFKYMIHKIHTGTDLEGPYTVYGFGGTAHPFNEEIHFPGLRQECSICHVNGSENLPIAEEALPTVILDENDQLVRQILPATAACTACHDNVINVFHAQLQSDLGAGVESCAVCHGPGEAFGVDSVHALSP
jgi:OmcA/MtrC family decaheme c-type cytochrome